MGDGYADAFYELGRLLDLGASTDSPKVVWERDMLPRLQSLVRSHLKIANELRACAMFYAEGTDMRNTLTMLAEWVDARLPVPSQLANREGIDAHPDPAHTAIMKDASA